MERGKSAGKDKNISGNVDLLEKKKTQRKVPLVVNLKKERERARDQPDSDRINNDKNRKHNPYTEGLVRKQAVELEDLGAKANNKGVNFNQKAPLGIESEAENKKLKGQKEDVKGIMKNKSSPDDQNNPYPKKGNVNKTKSDLATKSTVQKLEESEKFKSMKEKNIKKIETLKSMFYYKVESKKEVVDYILASGNYDSRNREVPWYIILPNGKWKRTWDFFVTFFLLYSLIIVPIDVGWNVECFTSDQGQFVSSTYLACTILFFFDIFLNFFTAFLNEKNQYIYKLEEIAQHYLTTTFAFDALSALPFDRFSQFQMTDCFQPYIATSKIFLLFNLVRFLKLGKYIAIIEDLLHKYITMVRLGKIFLMLLYLAHLFGNLFAGNSSYTTDVVFQVCDSETTLKTLYACQKNQLENNFISVYFYSVFIGIFFLTGNSLNAKQSWERMYQICVLLIALGLNASIFGNVAVIIGKMSVGLDPFVQEKIDIMKEYMNFMRFEIDTINTIEEYHKNIWMKQRNMMYPHDFFDNLSSALHKLILLDQWRKSFFEVSSFLPDVSERFFSDMLPLFRPKIFMKDDVIISEGEVTTGAIFFIPKNGTCSVKIGGEWVRNMIVGEFFGEVAIFLRSRRRTATITCLKNSDFLSIEGEDFEKLLQDYPEDFESIKIIAKDRILSHIKLYPSKLFANLVPKNELKDYLLRKCIYLNDEEEDRTFEEKEAENVTINLDKILPRIELCNDILNIAKNRMVTLNKKLKSEEEMK